MYKPPNETRQPILENSDWLEITDTSPLREDATPLDGLDGLIAIDGTPAALSLRAIVNLCGGEITEGMLGGRIEYRLPDNGLNVGVLANAVLDHNSKVVDGVGLAVPMVAAFRGHSSDHNSSGERGADDFIAAEVVARYSLATAVEGGVRSSLYLLDPVKKHRIHDITDHYFGDGLFHGDRQGFEELAGGGIFFNAQMIKRLRERMDNESGPDSDPRLVDWREKDGSAGLSKINDNPDADWLHRISQIIENRDLEAPLYVPKGATWKDVCQRGYEATSKNGLEIFRRQTDVV